MSEGTVFIIMGATGDLSKRKLIPAIHRLLKSERLKDIAIIGLARSDTSMKEIIDKAHIDKPDKKILTRLEQRSHYTTLDFYNVEEYAKLRTLLDGLAEKGYTKRVFYLATLPEHFDAITENLSKIGVGNEKEGWSRVVYEKPFGEDLKSAKRINKCIARIFDESQVYRVDHYLEKELVGSLALTRFTNRVLEPLWNRNHLESVQIIMKEDLTIGDRGGFYDRYGALKDVVQNHMLQMLALTAMEAPKELTGDYIRDEKAKVLKNVTVKDVLLGQYEGYTREEGVERDSKTETFAALKMVIDNSRWKGVPFYLKTGKALDKKQTEIHLKFKEVDCLLAKSCPSDTNYFVVRVQPDEGVALEINTKVPGEATEITQVTLDFCHSCTFGPNTPEAYEQLLHDVVKGDQSVFIRNDEIEHEWRIIEQVKKGTVHTYKKGSKGPKELERFNKKHSMRWRA